MTWGETHHSKDSSAVQGQLKDVQGTHASECEFAAVLGDGFSVTWSLSVAGGDRSSVQGQRRNMRHGTSKNARRVQASVSAFSAALGDGSVVTVGDAGFNNAERSAHPGGNDCSAV